MRQITISGKNYKISGEIIKRAINPFKGKLGASGGLEYDDFGNASLEEYHDLRGGIGRQSELSGETDRLWWTEGIDFSTARSAVLSSLVTTAGAFGVAPVKIIDFQGATYAIGNSKISKWNTGTSAWDSKDTSLANPIDAIVVTDDTDEYLIVSSATAAVYTVDGTTWIAYPINITPTSHNDPSAAWANEANAYDDNTATAAVSTSSVDGGWHYYLELLLANGIPCSSVRYFVGRASAVITKIDLDVYYDGGWHDVFEGTPTWDAWETRNIPGGSFLVTKARIRFYNDGSGGGDEVASIYEFDFINQFGYMADYDNRLYFISTNGNLISYSTAKNIDLHSGGFSLTGNYGTVYDFFEGKLLSDGSPTLYFCGNEGLFSLDTTNQKAYKQEIAYPPLTYSGHKGLYWNSFLWVATGYGILKVTPSMATFIGADLDDGLPSTYQGYVYDMETVSNWLVYCVNSGASGYSSIIKRNASVGGNLQIYTGANNTAIACLHHSPSSLYTNGRLWFGEGTNVKYMMFPDTTSNVKQIATYEYVNDSGYGLFPIFRKLAAISKTALGVAAITKSCDANEYIEVFYGLNGAAPTTSLGTFLTSPRPTILTFNSGLGTAFYTIQLAIKLYRGDTITNSPELESLLFYYIPTPAVINGWTFNIEATNENSDAIITEMEAIRDTQILTPFYPSGDVSKSVHFVKLTTMPLRFWHEERQSRQGYIQVDVQQIFSG